VKFRDLPGFPSLFTDFAEGAEPARSFFPCVPDAARLRQRAEYVQDPILPRQVLCDWLIEQAAQFKSGAPALTNIQRLRMPQTVAIVATLRPSLFGGPLCSFLKVVTAAKLASWLTGLGLPAIPICWIDGKIQRADLSIGLPSTHGPCRFELALRPEAIDGIPGSISDLLQDTATALETTIQESEVLQLLESAYEPGLSFVMAWARLISKIIEPLGIVLFDPQYPGIEIQDLLRKASVERAGINAAWVEQERRLQEAGYDFEATGIASSIDGPHRAEIEAAQILTPFLMQNLVLPAAACVMGEYEAGSFARDQVVFAKLLRKPPVIWPRISATLLDERSRKVMSRYSLGLDELGSGPESVTSKLMQRGTCADGLNRLGGLKAKVDVGLSQLAGLVNPEDKLSACIKSARRRMFYQIEKLRDDATKSELRRMDVIRGRVARLCNNLMPNGELQERAVAGFVFFHRYSSLLALRLYEGVDPWKFEHQLIFL